MTLRPLIGVGVIAVAAAIVLAVALGSSRTPSTSAADPSATADTRVSVPPTSGPVPGHEVFGYVPYWEMDEGIAEQVAGIRLTTVALFSVTHTKDGSLDTGQTGYKRITGVIGRRLIREAHDRGVAVQLAYSSFGTRKNERLFASQEAQGKAIDGLVALAVKLDVDGINVDIEQLDADLVPAYGAFVGRLRTALHAERPDGQVSVATSAGPTGAAMALAASTNGADRIFLMGYDYHYAGSDVGASAPLDRRDGAEQDLAWSLDLYAAVGVPVERTILGLPLYGMRWRVIGPWLGAMREGNGAIWVPADNPRFLAGPPVPPELDPIEVVEFYAVPPPGGASPGPNGSGTEAGGHSGWQAIYVDSPQTLAPKLALANERGLAGAGFWAIGYTRGLPGYTDLIERSAAGRAP